MSNYSEKIRALRNEVDGTISVMLVNAESGMLLSAVGDQVDPEVIGAGMSAFASSFNAVLAEMGNGAINETVFTVGGQFHAMHRVAANPSIYLMAIVDARQANLATVRGGVQRTAASITL